MTDVQDSSNDVSSDDDDDDEDKEEDPMEESLVNLYDQRARASSASVMQEADHPRKVGSNGPSPTRFERGARHPASRVSAGSPL